jgi:Raf kinase inhibitor-like YbhB/YbcL family protein
MDISSAAFKNMEWLPLKYGYSHENVNPPLTIKKIPLSAKSLVLIVDDPDAPSGTFVHWVLFNIPIISEIKENSSPGISGINSYKTTKYDGPLPPFGTHRYFFKIYALDLMLDLPSGASVQEVQNKMKGHILDQAQIIGLFKKE